MCGGLKNVRLIMQQYAGAMPFGAKFNKDNEWPVLYYYSGKRHQIMQIEKDCVLVA